MSADDAARQPDQTPRDAGRPARGGDGRPPVAGSGLTRRRRRERERAAGWPTRRGERQTSPPRRPPSTGRRTLTPLLAASVATLLVVGAGSWWVLHRPRPVRPQVVVTQPSGDRTLLVVLVAPGGGVAAGELLAADAGSASALLIPGYVQVNAPTGTRSLSSVGSGGPAAAGGAVSATLGVRVDATWSLTESGLAALIDADGGVLVDVDKEVHSGGVLVAAGHGQRLTGAEAAAFAVMDQPGEGPQVEPARFSAVLTAMIETLPPVAAGIATELSPLGGGSRSSVPAATLAELLATVSARLGGEALSASDLPTALRAGALVVDPARTAILLRGRFSGALLGAGRPVAPGVARSGGPSSP